MAKCLAIDYGLERVGLAISDPLETMAFPLETLRMRNFPARSALLDAVAARAAGEQAEIIVMGLPLLRDGGETLSCRQARNAAARLMRRLPLPFYYMPEFLSSEAAWQDLREAGVKMRKRKAVLDQQAACLILSSFLALPESERMRA